MHTYPTDERPTTPFDFDAAKKAYNQQAHRGESNTGLLPPVVTGQSRYARPHLLTTPPTIQRPINVFDFCCVIFAAAVFGYALGSILR